MKLDSTILVKPGSAAKLAHRDPHDRLDFNDKAAAKAGILADAAEINLLQDRLYAESARALLVVLQGTDTAGKDGAIREVFNDTGPVGVAVTSFKQPSEVERAHDYLWRVHAACPPRGWIGVFNRSHYEDVLVVKVKKLAPAADIEQRYDQINAFEKLLVENGTAILKFMLHISPEEQRQRLLARLDDPDKRWKFQAGDLEDLPVWEDYQVAYEAALTRCSTEYAPWRVVPSDRKWVRSAVIAHCVRAKLEEMNPRPRVPDWDPQKYRDALSR
jgi:PPK2 family polyphosphate:nucleotide phosphotransferase